MMNNQLLKALPSLFLLLALVSCTSSIRIDGFSSIDWKSDRNGCDGKRIDYVEAIENSKEKILGQSERAVLKLMGRPDKNELYRRQQKFYIYYLQPGPLCNDLSAKSDTASYLSLRFNATGVVNEIFIYE